VDEDEMSDDTYAAGTGTGPGYTRPGTADDTSHDRADAMLSCIAFTMVVIGATGAMIGLAKSTPRRRTRRSWRVPGDRYELTPPHGDKLHPNS
jgi:hypothetical protein